MIKILPMDLFRDDQIVPIRLREPFVGRVTTTVRLSDQCTQMITRTFARGNKYKQKRRRPLMYQFLRSVNTERAPLHFARPVPRYTRKEEGIRVA